MDAHSFTDYKFARSRAQFILHFRDDLVLPVLRQSLAFSL